MSRGVPVVQRNLPIRITMSEIVICPQCCGHGKVKVGDVISTAERCASCEGKGRVTRNISHQTLWDD